MAGQGLVYDGVHGDPRLIRVFPGAARIDPECCPEYRALKTQPGMRPRVPRHRKDRGLEGFPLGVLNDVLDSVEQRGCSPEEAVRDLCGVRRLHRGLRSWLARAAGRYAEAVAKAQAESGVTVDPRPRGWVVQSRVPGVERSVVYEVCAWGRTYESRDASVRELRVLRINSVVNSVRDPAEVATAAFVLAAGRPVRCRTRFDQPHLLGEADEPRRVRVVDVGCTEGSCRVLFDGSPQEAKELYDFHSRSRLRAVVDGKGYRPGPDCARCALLAECPAVPRCPGLLGIDDVSKPRRTWSITDGRNYRSCPAREHLRRLNLPRQDEYDEAAVRGMAVHAWLQEQHARQPRRPCSSDEVPGAPEEWRVGGYVVSGRQALLGWQMVGDHALVCPFNDAGNVGEVRVEEPIFAYDPDADVVVVAKPDLQYRDGDTWVMRETKTSIAVEAADLLERYPQLALGVLLQAAGAVGVKAASTRVELERLTAAGPVVDVFDPSDPDVLAHARAVVRELAAGWHADLDSPPRPGPQCRRCEVSAWCPDAASGVGEPA